MQQFSSMKKRLGDILVDVGIITPEQLQEALDIQKRAGGKLGSILAQTGALNEEVMLAFLGKQCGVLYISLAEYGEIPSEVIQSVPESVVRHQMLIPITREGNTLTVAMADPFNVFAVDDVKLMTGHDVQVVIASEQEIKAAIEKYYTHVPESLSAPAQDAVAVPVQGTAAAAYDNEPAYSIISRAIKERASDIHIEPQFNAVRIRYRIDGILYEKSVLEKDLQEKVLNQVKSIAGLDLQEKRIPQVGRVRAAIDSQSIALQASIVPSVFGEKAVLKIIRPLAPYVDLAKLGFEPEALAVYRDNVENPNGMVLITGPRDSGKTMTLYSTLITLNHPDRNILTIEDGIEHILSGVTQIQLRPDIGFGYFEALRASEWQNANVIMMSEIPDQKTANLALNVALAGQEVFSTLSANDTVDTLVLLANMGIEPYLIASALTMVVAQRLVRTVCPDCRESYTISRENLRGLGIKLQNLGDKDTITLYRGKGCAACALTGYTGRTAVYEVLKLDERIRTLILERAPESVLREAAISRGLFTLREAAWRKVLAGVSSVEELLRITRFSHY